MQDRKLFRLVSANAGVLRQHHIDRAPVLIDHYCYTGFEIYAGRDTIHSERMRDLDFRMYPAARRNERSAASRNGHVRANNASAWNALIEAAGSTLVKLPETLAPEREAMRRHNP